MSKGTARAEKILQFLEAIYPEAATITQISSKTGIPSCSANQWIKTLLVSREIESSGKKGRYNLYRYRPK